MAKGTHEEDVGRAGSREDKKAYKRMTETTRPCQESCAWGPDGKPEGGEQVRNEEHELGHEPEPPAPAPVEMAGGICHHGSLRRACETCDCDEQIAALRAELAQAKEESK